MRGVRGAAMKILHVIPSIDPASGGPAEGLRQLCPVYVQGGHEVDVASLDSPEAILSYDFPARVFALGPGWGVFGYSRHAKKWLRDNIAGYDVVFVDGVWQYNTLAAYDAVQKTDIPYAIFTHGMLDPYFKKRFPFKHIKKSIYWRLFLERILRNASAVLFTSEEEKILARQSFPRFRAREIVVPFGIRRPVCDTADAAEEFLTQWPVLRGKRVAISMGRIHPKKGTDILIEAFARTLAVDPMWRLVIAGPDSVGLRRDLEVLANSLGIGDRITWTGMLRGAVKWGALAAAEVFVMPSHQENFGIVIAEAMASNLPVILSDKVNIWREVERYRAGLVCEDSVGRTAECLARWQALTGKEITAFRLRSRQCFEELFNYDVTEKMVLEIVDLIVHETKGR
jgi:glycosyltransferase involved in cell wall biosynthesis